MKILFVCTGNTCRSPMAEALAKKQASENALEDITITSAGLAAFDGQPAARNAVDAMAELGIDISEFRAKCVTDKLISETDFFVPMTFEQKLALQSFGIPNEKFIDFTSPIPDPYGGNRETYQKCRDALNEQIEIIFMKVLKVSN